MPPSFSYCVSFVIFQSYPMLFIKRNVRIFMLRFGYLGKWSPCVYESLNTKGKTITLVTLLYDSNFTLT
jgi:hypothetical protein